MIYKFQGKSGQQEYVSFELKSEANMLLLSIDPGGEDSHIGYADIYLNKRDIDDLIIALSALKNEISEYERT